ncbi:MAG: hypothetical protein NZ561_12790 [Phycisphaerae bacterium]|nr:hypothetical protein [Phycisphaerae bacterium]MDW8262940.1 hypothetical protein [Phycisphaerales bacterium]
MLNRQDILPLMLSASLTARDGGPKYAPMLRGVFPCCCLALLLAGASCQPHTAPAQREAAFGPERLRLHPVFTRFKDWTGDGEPDGIEAMVEFLDAFGDPTKASGRLIFELFEYKTHQPDPRGRRLASPWIGELTSDQAQRERWNRASRTYAFQLALPGLDPARDYVLTAQFDSPDGRRFFDQLVVEARREGTRRPATQPATREMTRGDR